MKLGRRASSSSANLKLRRNCPATASKLVTHAATTGSTAAFAGSVAAVAFAGRFAAPPLVAAVSLVFAFMSSSQTLGEQIGRGDDARFGEVPQRGLEVFHRPGCGVDVDQPVLFRLPPAGRDFVQQRGPLPAAGAQNLNQDLLDTLELVEFVPSGLERRAVL